LAFTWLTFNLAQVIRSAPPSSDSHVKRDCSESIGKRLEPDSRLFYGEYCMVRFLSLSLVFCAAVILAVASSAHDDDSGTAQKCSAGKCDTGAGTAGKCSQGSCPATCTLQEKCTEGKCTEGKCTEGKCTGTDGKCCGTCGNAKPADGKCTDEKCSEGGCGGACGGTCTGACSADKTATKQECPITVAMKNLPQTTYLVGDKKTCCPDGAAALAEKSGDAILFIVAGKEFACKDEAHLALVEATESFVAAFAEPKVCEKTGTCTVAGKKACCPNVAATTSKKLKAAMDQVKMSYVVGDKECGCPNMAKKLAKDSGKATEFVVAGEKTCCNVTARLQLARAKYKAAVVAMMTDAKESAADDS
jgi:hypothetical protein